MNAIQCRLLAQPARQLLAAVLLATFALGVPRDVNAADRGRPAIVNGSLVTDQGTLMRGSTFWEFGNIPGRIDWANNPSAWPLLTQNHLNCARLAIGYNNTDIYPPTGVPVTLTQYLTWLDTQVNLASQNNC